MFSPPSPSNYEIALEKKIPATFCTLLEKFRNNILLTDVQDPSLHCAFACTIVVTINGSGKLPCALSLRRCLHDTEMNF